MSEISWWSLQTEEQKEKHKARFHDWKNKNPSRYLWHMAKRRAKLKNIEFTISPEDIIIPTHCPILEMELKFNRGGKGTRQRSNSPSLDRIDNTRGYVKDNIQVISFKANAMKYDSTFEEIEKLYKFYLKLKDNT